MNLKECAKQLKADIPAVLSLYERKEKIISMYAKGMTTTDIESHMRELYDVDISDSTVSRITDKILPIVREWQERPLYSSSRVHNMLGLIKLLCSLLFLPFRISKSVIFPCF